MMDNQSDMKQADSFDIREASKHIQVRNHWVKRAVKDGLIRFMYVKSGENLADLQTKTFTERKTQELCRMIGLISEAEFCAKGKADSSPSRGGCQSELNSA